MRIVAGRTKAACGIVFIKYGVHSLGDKGYVRYWHKADIPPRSTGRCENPLTEVEDPSLLWRTADIETACPRRADP